MGLSKEGVLKRHTCLIMAVAGSALMLGTVAGYAQSSSAPPSDAQSSDTPASSAPSLGDLVRKQKQKQQQEKDKGVKPKKVVTDEDMPERPEASSTDADSTTDESPQAGADVTPASVVAHTGEQWKASISQQKSAIADLKSRIEKVQSSIHFVEANAYRNGVQYNKAQAHKQEEVERAQNQLAEMQKSLEKMQEDARRAGYGSAVWDP
jgi:hypothetical protein